MADRLAVMRGRSLAAENGLAYIELSRRALNPQAVRAVPFELLQQLVAVPFDLDEGTLHVALTEPSTAAVTELERVTGRHVSIALASREDVDRMLLDLSRSGTLEVDELRLEGELTENAPAVRTVNDILRKAVVAQASDVHLIPDERCVHVRLRIDGVVQEHAILTTEEAGSVVSRIKVVARMDVAEHRRPQDGRFTIRTTAGRVIDIRTTVLPTVHGEGVVLRLLGKTRTAPSFTDLGLSNAMQMELERLVDRAVGSVLVTGPTGSGKSTTLASLVDIINSSKPCHIMTVEDPIEFLHNHKMAVVNQREVGEDTNSFSSALKHVLRQDPDVILVGEMRDLETISTALTAAETGHLVFATLHTQDAPQSIDRVIDVFPAHQQQQIRVQLASALQGVVTQQLVPKIGGKGRAVAAEVLVATPAVRN
ncbi:MAG: twitching motility protein PilT, partial [Gaiellaceae bacterium]|nr:twitching motility protein PilT [Gaiellaceae bacterium]